jgi:uncharacterized cupin superfamily protein
MARIPISAPAFEYDDTDPEGFRCGMVRVGKVVGAKLTGASVYELPPGQTLCPYHYEYGEEEWALVLDGTATLRTPQGTEPLGPMELAFFPTGPEGAHSLANDTAATVRVLMFSNYAAVTATAYPDSDKVGVWTGVEGENLMAPRSADVPYYHGEA